MIQEKIDSEGIYFAGLLIGHCNAVLMAAMYNQHLEAVEPVLAVVPDKWMPIKTAPYRKYVLVFAEGEVMRGFFGRVVSSLPEMWFDDNCSRFDPQPSHWMPLPAAPKPTHEGE
jgi:hypothetical protein